MYKRDITTVISKRLQEPRRFVQVITGPRQVGKTTAIQQVLAELAIPSHYAAADLPAPPATEWIAQQWERARSMTSTAPAPTILVLDEVQRISHWSIEVKRLWDEDARLGRQLHVVILGSSALWVQRGLEDSLAGRFEIIRCPQWSWTECREAFGWSLEQYVYFGGYPGAAALIRDEPRWRQYMRDALIETAISKDILLLNRVDKPALLRQLFVLACEYGGQILSYQKILGQLADAGHTETLASYQRLLESAFLLRGLPKWSGSAVRRRGSSPKWLPLSTGLMTALSNQSFAEWRADPQRWGRLVEVTVGAHLVNTGTAQGVEVFYWRDGNKEADFVVRHGARVTAIEVKSGSRRMTQPGLTAFAKHYAAAKTLTVGSPEWSLQQFLEAPPPVL